MNFGPEECAKAAFRRGRFVATRNLEINKNIVIWEPWTGECCKYLHVEESAKDVEQQQMKDRVTEECCGRVRQML